MQCQHMRPQRGEYAGEQQDRRNRTECVTHRPRLQPHRDEIDEDFARSGRAGEPSPRPLQPYRILNRGNQIGWDRRTLQGTQIETQCAQLCNFVTANWTDFQMPIAPGTESSANPSSQ